MAFSAPISKSTGDLVTAADWVTNTVDNVNALLPIGLQYLINAGGAVIPTGIQGPLIVPAKCDINSCTLLLDQAATVTIDIWMDTYANYPPTNADTITGANEPATAAADKDQDSTLTNWTTALPSGVTLYYNVDANDVALWCLVALGCSRS